MCHGLVQAAGFRVAMVKSDKDVRYAKSSVVAHDGQSRVRPTLRLLQYNLRPMLVQPSCHCLLWHLASPSLVSIVSLCNCRHFGMSRHRLRRVSMHLTGLADCFVLH
jgi:hypothetical protein